MKKDLRKMFLLFLFLVSYGFISDAHSATMSDYCQIPPFVSSAVEPNVLLVIDVSGSMGWKAYSYGDTDADGNGYLDGYNPAVTYEGYFDPSKYYKPDANGIYEEATPTGEPCTTTCVEWTCRRSDWGGCVWQAGGCPRWGCCTRSVSSGDCGLESGNYLNYDHMARIDLLRWAMTGGTPSSCTGAQTFNPDYCDPELWNTPRGSGGSKVGTVCNDTLDVNGDGVADGGCILRSFDGTQVKVRWNRVNDALAFKFKELLGIRPRMAAMFFSGTSVRAQKVYMGDFTAPNSTETNFPYMNLITHLNSSDPANATPTAPAMWDALNYYAQKSPEYGGFTPQSGSGDKWRNPMYVCDQGGANCVYVPCANNFVILMSDGQWNRGGGPPAAAACSIDIGFENHSADPVVPAYKMHMGFTNVVTGVNSKVSAVYSIGLFLGGTGERSLKNVAMYGAFDNAAKTWPDNLAGYPDDTCNMADCGAGKGSACEPLPPSSPDWDKDADGKPDTFYSASTAYKIKQVIIDAILDILRRASSGTAVSVLASGEGSGANLLQAIFYPKRTFGETEIDWTGELQNLWYYLDPKLQSSTIREDTVSDNVLDLQNDYVAQIYFDTIENKAKVRRLDNSGNVIDTIDLDDLKTLWDALSGKLQGAGDLLWYRDLGVNPRKIYTTIDGSNPLSFSTDNAATLQNYLQAATVAEATNIINYVHGTDLAGYRNRTVTIPNVDNTPRVWKLGDIVSSTPKIQSWIRLNTYNSEAPFGYSDQSYQKFIDSKDYKKRGMVYVGANDGMLHALKLGLLEMTNDPSNPNEVAKLCDDTNSNAKCDPGETTTNSLGKEEWAYIPKNALPYLKYLTDPGYCHLYYVDMTPYLFDASINKPTGCTEANYWDCDRKVEYLPNPDPTVKILDLTKTSWRTVIIGGMGQGGACRNSNVNCAGADCVSAPITNPAGYENVGLSSYFALDITDPQNPKLLWEFSHSELGFSITGPVIVRTGNNQKNGRWFAVFASGPTGPIDTSAHQFLGRSNQNLKLFVVDLATGSLVRTIDTGIANAFGGSMFNVTLDTDRWKSGSTGNYQDDVFYVGYTQWSGTNWVGGILRVTTKENTDPNQWVLSTVINGIGPVTSSIAHLQDRKNHKLWLYFGTGRYFYKTGTTIDDANSQQAIYGIKEPCYDGVYDQFNKDCTTSVSKASLADATTTPPATEPANGWYINLDCSYDGTCSNKAPTGYLAERVITNPLAAFTGAVFFTTFSPTADVCGFGGYTYLWAVGYSTGGLPPSSALRGTALIQVSTGEIKEIDLSKPETWAQRGSRRTAGFSGIPPKGQGLSVVISPRPIKRILHIQER